MKKTRILIIDNNLKESDEMEAILKGSDLARIFFNLAGNDINSYICAVMVKPD
jgi:hypothetical protein